MRRVLAAVALVSLALAGAPQSAAADTGTVVEFSNAIATAPWVGVVVVNDGPPAIATWKLTAVRVYRGEPWAQASFEPSAGDIPARPGERWFVALAIPWSLDLSSTIALRIADDDRIVPRDDLDGVPASLAELDALLGGPGTASSPDPAASAAAPATAAAPAAVDAHRPDDGEPAGFRELRDSAPSIAAAFVVVVLLVGLGAAAVARSLAKRRGAS